MTLTDCTAYLSIDRLLMLLSIAILLYAVVAYPTVSRVRRSLSAGDCNFAQS